MGMVHAIQTGKFHGRPSKHLLDAASTMRKNDVKHFAETKHEGLPEHVKDAASEFQKGMKEEAEHPVDTTTRKEIVRDHLREKPDYYTVMSRCMKKSSNCTSHDPNIPESFDGRQKPIEVKKLKGKKAFFAGFAKAAAEAGFTPGQTLDLLQKKAMPSWMEPYSPAASDITASFLTMPAMNGALGTLAGAGIGGVGGYLSGRNKENPEQDHSIRNALLGGVGGAAAGGVAGSAGTLGVLANKHPEIFNRILAGAISNPR